MFPDPAALLPPAPRLLATLLPSANTVVERTTIALLHGLKVAPLFTRVPKRGAVDPFPDSHDTEGLLAAAELLADARPDAIVLSAGKGAAIGLEHDRALVAAIRGRFGIPADTPGLALLRALAALGITRIGLIGPHARGFNDRVAQGLAAEGITVLAQAALGLADNLAFASVRGDVLAAMARQVARAEGVQAVVAWNTNSAAAPLAATLEAELGLPLLDATALGVWGGLGVAGIAARPGPGWGRLFTLEARA
jgi:maleate isomerase